MLAIASAKAPGKLVLTGDYAVLFDAPAIALAVDRYASVDVFASDNGSWLESPGMANGRQHFELNESAQIRWQTAQSGKFELFERLARPLLLHYDRAQGLGLRLNTNDFYAQGRKLGLGSSAALSVAMERVSALLGVRSDADEDHRGFQCGKGSGVDIAAATNGGVLEFRRRAPSQSRQLSWPDDLRFQVVDTGRSTSTATMIGRLDRWRKQEPDVAAQVLTDLSKAAEAAVKAWSNDVAGLLLVIEEYARQLRRLDKVSGLGIFAGGHAEIAHLASLAGVVYKPSGAGGGDIGVAFASDFDALQEFTEACTRAGFSILELGRSPCGVEAQLR